MKRTFFIVFGLGIAIIACRKSAPEAIPTASAQSGTPGNGTGNTTHAVARLWDSTTQYGSRFIKAADANQMISSYLASINSQSNDSDIRSLTVNADSLRAYIANSSVKNIKLMFAHTLAWSTANPGVSAGYRSGAITIVIAAYDSVGNYVYYNGSSVLDYSAPCPSACITSGTASSYLLQ